MLAAIVTATVGVVPLGAQTTSPLSSGGNIYRNLDRAVTRPLAVPPPSTPSAPSTWVPDRYVTVPGVQNPVHVPGHYEQSISPTEAYTPPLIGTSPDGTQVVFPAGVRPRVDERQAP